MRRFREHVAIDPTQPLEGNAVAYFTIGDPDEGDPESLALVPGQIPTVVVAAYMQKRIPGAMAQSGPRPGEVVVRFTDRDGQSYTFTTKVEVQGRR